MEHIHETYPVILSFSIERSTKKTIRRGKNNPKCHINTTVALRRKLSCRLGRYEN